MNSPFRFASLRTTLIVPYVGLVLLLTTTLTGLFYWAGSQAVSRLADQLLAEMVQRVRLTAQHHMRGSSAVLEVAFPEGLPAPTSVEDDWDSLYQRFWAATAIHPKPNDYVYYGNTEGQGFGLKRLDETNVELRAKIRAEDHRQYYHVQGINGIPIPSHLEETLFDPRTRPWFTIALQTSSHTWTSVYIDFSAKDLVVTRARRVDSWSGEMAGVVATDVFLNELESFVRSLQFTPNGQAFIIEPDGNLIASSRVPNLRESDAGILKRVSVRESGDAPILAIYDAIQPHIEKQGGLDGDSYMILRVKDTDNVFQYVALTRITDEAGLNWIAVVAVPERDILGNIFTSMVGSLLLGLMATLTLVLIGLRTFNRVASDIADLTQAARKVGQGELDVTVHVTRKDEVGELARSFQEMHSDLFTDRLTGVANRSALNHFLDAAVMHVDEDPSQAFALLFIDLNRFKPLNDRYGHENGDRALAEVAQRLRETVRSDDLVARLGGDEFVVILRHVSSQHAAEAASRKIDAALRAPLSTLTNVPHGEEVTVGCAIGIALCPLHGRDPQALLMHADAMMYQDKGQRQR